MAPPATVAFSFDILNAVRAGGIAGAFRFASTAGRARLDELARSPGDPCAQALLGWSGTAQGRLDAATARCRFGDLPDGTVAVLFLTFGAEGTRLSDVRVVGRAEYESFGRLDEPMPLIPPYGTGGTAR